MVLCASPTGSLPEELKKIQEQPSQIEEKDFTQSSKFRTWKRRQKRKASKKRAAEARVVPFPRKRSDGQVSSVGGEAAVVVESWPSVGRGRGLARFCSDSQFRGGRGRGLARFSQELLAPLEASGQFCSE